MLIFPSFIWAQVTVGGNILPNEGALLDLKENNGKNTNSTKGLGVPRVNLVNVDDLSPCAINNQVNKESHKGLVVYNLTDNTSNVDTLKKGIYMWDGDNWQPFGLSAGIGYGPWFQVENPALPSRNVDTDSYLDANAVVGGATIIDDATLSIHGKVAIGTSTTFGAFKYVDGNQGASKVLISDDSGLATWQINTGGMNALYQHLICSATTNLYFPQNQEITIPGIEPFQVENSGKYELIFHSFFVNPVTGPKSYYVKIYVNGTLVREDETYSYAPGNSYINQHYPVIIDITTPGSTIDVRIQGNTGTPFYISGTALGKRVSLDVIYLGL